MTRVLVYRTEKLTVEMKTELEKQNGFIFNTSRRTANFFSCDALMEFLKRNDLSHVVRAHEVQHVGFKASPLDVIYRLCVWGSLEPRAPEIVRGAGGGGAKTIL